MKRLTLIVAHSAATFALVAGCGGGPDMTEDATLPVAAGLKSAAAPLASEAGIGAQAVPNLGFADKVPAEEFHVSINGSDSNPGSASAPWRTLNKAVASLHAGQAAYVHAGNYYERVSITDTAEDGTAEAPIQLLAAPGEHPVIMGGDGKSGTFLRIAHNYWVVDGLTINGAGSFAAGVFFDGARFAVIRGMEIFGGTGPNAVVIANGSEDIGVLGSKMHHFTWGTQDSHGILVLPDVARVMIRGNESYANGGDAFQCQGPDVTDGTAAAVDITVEGNRFHEDQENAVDIKTCDRVTIRKNKFFGYRAKATAPQGSAMVVHYSASNILIEGNRLWNNGRGLSLGGVQVGSPVTNVVVRRNLLFDHSTEQQGSGDGLRFGTSVNVRVYNNTLVNMPNAGIRLGDGDNGPAVNLQVFNNILVDTGSALDVHTAGVWGLFSDRNLAWNSAGPVAFRVNSAMTGLSGWVSALGQDKTSRLENPRFIGSPRSHDFYTQVASPARDVALVVADVASPMCGAGPDLGFLESCN